MIKYKLLWLTLIFFQVIIVIIWIFTTVWGATNIDTNEMDSIKKPYPVVENIAIIIVLIGVLYRSIRHFRSIGVVSSSNRHEVTGKSISTLKERFFSGIIDLLLLSPLIILPYLIDIWTFKYYCLHFIGTSFFFLYDLIFDWKTGQTIGKKILNIQVYELNGNSLSFKNALFRSLPSCLYAISILLIFIVSYNQLISLNYLQLPYSEISNKLESDFPSLLFVLELYLIFYSIDLLFILIRSDKRALHDIIGYAIVLKKNE